MIRFAIGNPMSPSPMNPTLIASFAISLLSPLGSRSPYGHPGTRQLDRRPVFGSVEYMPLTQTFNKGRSATSS
jgi:hypothetical protein